MIITFRFYYYNFAVCLEVQDGGERTADRCNDRGDGINSTCTTIQVNYTCTTIQVNYTIVSLPPARCKLPHKWERY